MRAQRSVARRQVLRWRGPLNPKSSQARRVVANFIFRILSPLLSERARRNERRRDAINAWPRQIILIPKLNDQKTQASEGMRQPARFIER